MSEARFNSDLFAYNAVIRACKDSCLDNRGQCEGCVKDFGV